MGASALRGLQLPPLQALCGYLMLDGGAELRYVAEYLGHEKIESTKLYTRVSLEKLRAVHRDTHPTEK